MKREDDFEKQLMKDNLTIKEQIANLQKTISRLKNDMIVSEKNENKHRVWNGSFGRNVLCDERGRRGRYRRRIHRVFEMRSKGSKRTGSF